MSTPIEDAAALLVLQLGEMTDALLSIEFMDDDGLRCPACDALHPAERIAAEGLHREHGILMPLPSAFRHDEECRLDRALTMVGLRTFEARAERRKARTLGDLEGWDDEALKASRAKGGA